MTKPKTEIWWTLLRYGGGRKAQIKPYLTEPFDGRDMLESMAELLTPAFVFKPCRMALQ